MHQGCGQAGIRGAQQWGTAVENQVGAELSLSAISARTGFSWSEEGGCIDVDPPQHIRKLHINGKLLSYFARQQYTSCDRKRHKVPLT